LSENVKGRGHLRDIDIDGRIIFKRILNRVADSCEHGNKHLGSIKSGGFVDQLSNYQLFKKDCVPWG
jgi:hypothetical protein